MAKTLPNGMHNCPRLISRISHVGDLGDKYCNGCISVIIRGQGSEFVCWGMSHHSLRHESSLRACSVAVQADEDLAIAAVRAPIRVGLMAAAVRCCGEVGYSNLSTDMIARRGGTTRSNFYRYFKSKTDCFESAYVWKAGWPAERLLSTAGAGCDLAGALQRLARFMVADPLSARALPW